MSDGIAVVWHGKREFEAALTKLNERIERNTVVAGLEAGHQLAEFAATKAPHRSGDLAGSIRATEAGRNRVLVGPTVDYGRRVELGFKGMTKGGKARRKKVLDSGGKRVGWTRRGLNATPPNPFLRDATAAFPGRFIEIHTRGWAKAIEST